MTEIRQLLQPSSDTKSREYALTFVNDTFSSLLQLEQEDTLQRAVRSSYEKSEELRAQLLLSQGATAEQISSALTRTRVHLVSARDLSLARHALADDLASLTADLESSLSHEQPPRHTLLEELESLQRNLKELETVRSYVAVVEHALRLSEAATLLIRQSLLTSQSQSFSPAALTGYEQLQSFVSTVSSACSVVGNSSRNQPCISSDKNEPQPLNLVSVLFKIRDRSWNDIKRGLSTKLLEFAEKMGWPQQMEYTSVSSKDHKLFETAFLDLLRLQEAGSKIHASDPGWKPEGIYPLQALTTPIALRFKYHFEGKRDTNRLDKPEWYFTHILNVTHTHRHFLETHVQAFLSNTAYREINAFREFTLHLLPLLSRKLHHTVPRLLHHPALLAHTVYQVLAFDTTVREQGFGIECTSAAPMSSLSEESPDNWGSISDQFLDNKEWFEAWLEGERKFAEDQYNEIISSQDAWQIVDNGNDEDGRSVLAWRPTNSARRVKALVEQITDRYQPIPRFCARTRFLIAVQIPILESYHSRISSSLDAFETLSSSFVRAVPGALAGQGHGTDIRRSTSGVEGIGRLIKAGLSAHFVAAAMERWGEDIFFLELWAEINSRAALRASVAAHPLLPDPTLHIASEVEIEAISRGTIFQGLVTQYRALAGRAEDMIVRHVCLEVESASRAYFLKQWDTFDIAPPNEQGISIPTTLVAPISLLSAHLDFLATSLPTPLVTIIYRRIISTIAALLLQRRILQRGVGRLTLSEAKQVAEECLLWVEACRMATGRVIRRVEGPWTRLLGAMKLVTLESGQFRVVVDRIFSMNADGLAGLQEDLEVSELDLEDMMDVVRVRDECWR